MACWSRILSFVTFQHFSHPCSGGALQLQKVVAGWELVLHCSSALLTHTLPANALLACLEASTWLRRAPCWGQKPGMPWYFALETGNSASHLDTGRPANQLGVNRVWKWTARERTLATASHLVLSWCAGARVSWLLHTRDLVSHLLNCYISGNLVSQSLNH